MSEKEDLVVVILEDIQESKAVLFHDQYGEAYIAINGDGSKIIRLGSKEFRQWVTKLSWQKYKFPLSQDAANKIAQTLIGIGRYDGSEIPLHVRNALDNKRLLYDLGESQPTVLISGDGWTLMKHTPIIFRRFPHQKNQVWPAQEFDIELLYKYVNLADEKDKLLFQIYAITAFIPGFPHPLLIFHGPQGSGKSTPMRVLKELIDPSHIQGLSSPKTTEGFVQLAHHHAFLFFDNLSNLPPWLSDALARASTGDGFSKRMLFTDDDDVFYTLQLPIALNGINQVITKPDLLDRSILLKLERISSDTRKSEEEFWSKFEIDKPQILGTIFEVLSKALKLRPTIKLKSLPRMADFARWGSAIAEAMGSSQEKFLEAYKANMDRQNDEAIEASSVAQAILILMQLDKEWEGTPAQLLIQLNKIAFANSLSQDYSWPKAPVWLTRRVNEVLVNLSAKGILIEHGVTAEGRIIKITKDVNSTETTVNTDIQPDDSTTVETEENDQQSMELGGPFDH